MPRRQPRQILVEDIDTGTVAEMKNTRRSTRKRPVKHLLPESEGEDLDVLELPVPPTRKRAPRLLKKEITLLDHPEPISEPIPEGFEYLEISLHDDSTRRELVISDTTTGKTSKKLPEYDRELREIMRSCHLLCLLIAYRIKSRFITAPGLRAQTLSMIPPHLLRQFSPEILEDGRTFLNSVSMMSNWFKNGFKRQSNLRVEDINLQLVKWLPERNHFTWLSRVAEERRGVDEDLVALFTCMLRGLGLETRFVVSLQAILVKPIGIGDDPIPKFWCEVMHPTERRWIHVDCLRAIVNDRLEMEPPPALLSKIGRQHLFIVGFEADGKPCDVTKRYSSKYYGWTAKIRKMDEGLIEFCTPLPPKEEDELNSLIDSEPIPTTRAGFSGNQRYMLERQLKKYEVFFPVDAGIVGDFKGENVRLRSAVQRVKSREAWYTQYGRVIKDQEAPAKVVRIPKKPETLTAKRKKNMAEWERVLAEQSVANPPSAKEYNDQPLWGEWQTIPYSPPIAADGKVPRNKFGNVDLYLMSMLPVGCIWIDDSLAWRAAKSLDIDYAAACVRFAFSGRFAVPNLRGIVVCAEFEGAVLRRSVEIKEEMAREAMSKTAEMEERKEKVETRKRKIKEKLKVEHGIVEGEPVQEDTIVSYLATTPSNKDTDLDDLF